VCVFYNSSYIFHVTQHIKLQIKLYFELQRTNRRSSKADLGSVAWKKRKNTRMIYKHRLFLHCVFCSRLDNDGSKTVLIVYPRTISRDSFYVSYTFTVVTWYNEVKTNQVVSTKCRIFFYLFPFFLRSRGKDRDFYFKGTW